MVSKKICLSKESNTVVGRNAELGAREFLRQQAGWRLVGQNFRWRGGEIDLIMLDGSGVLVFIEVRSASVRSPWLRYTIGPRKRVRLIRTAEQFRYRYPQYRRRPFRFDLVWIEAGKLEHWPNVVLA